MVIHLEMLNIDIEWWQNGNKPYGSIQHRLRTRVAQMSTANWDDVSYVISSRYRVETLRRLAEGPATPSHIATEVGMSVAHVSRALQELREHDLVALLVSEERKKGRVYGVTDTGDAVWKMIDAEDMLSENG